jgi:catechol O-methyltransferase
MASLIRRASRCSPLVSRVATARALSSQTKKTIQSASDFNELRERSLLRHVINTSVEGDAESVMTAMDTFWDTFFNGEGTAEWTVRGAALDSAIRTKQPKAAMEIGAYCGYTAVRMARLMPPDSKLISIEIDPLYAAIATKMVEHAGLRDRVSVEIGSVADRLGPIHRKHGLSGPLDAVLLDHDVSNYLPDLQLLEKNGHIAKGTVVLCDWSLYPGSDDVKQTPTTGADFMDYLSEIGVNQSTRHSLREKEIFTVSAGDWVGVI